MTMPTPHPSYRPKLPSCSPSSARLRKLAPSPVRIPATPPYVSPARFTPKSAGIQHPLTGLEDPFEYDFMPLERSALNTDTNESTRTRSGNTHPSFSPRMRVMRQDSTDSNVSIPLLFDARGDFGALAEKHRLNMGMGHRGPSHMHDRALDVPEELDMEWHQSRPDTEDDNDPFRYILPSRSLESDRMVAYDKPFPVLVQFKDDVFATKPIAVSQSFSSASSRQPSKFSTSSNFGRILPESRDLSVAESHYTFGRPDAPRRQSRESVKDDDDGWSYTLSAYGGDEDEEDRRSTRGSPFSPAGDMQPTPFLSPHVKDTDSPMSLPSSGSALFTPGYSVSNLPPTQYPSPSDSHASPVSMKPLPTLPTSPRTRDYGLGLTLTPSCSAESGIAARDRAGLSDIDNIASEPKTVQPRQTEHEPRQPAYLTVADESRGSGSTSSSNAETTLPDYIKQALQSVSKLTSVTLMIDQEGSREIHTTLQYRRIHKPHIFREREMKSLESAALWSETPGRPEPFQQTGCVEFGVDPKSRPKWNVHHAALEGLPVLRRCTVDDDEKHDYLSRGATLQIRDPGVYAVHGSEDKGRVEWKFEYLVQPRLSSSTGEVKPNEKIMIPLGFYVSPNFFNSDRALKLHLLNVFKKQLTPNIISEKVNPPRIGTPPSPRPSPSPSVSPLPAPTPPVQSSAGPMSRILKAVGSTRSGMSSPVAMETPVKAEKKGRTRAATLFNRSRPMTPLTLPSVLGTQAVEMIPTSSATPIVPENLRLPGRPATAQTFAASPSPLTLKAKTLMPIKSLSALRSAPLVVLESNVSHARRPLVPMKSLSSLAGTTRHRPYTAEPVPSLPALPTLPRSIPKSAHPFATHLTPISRGSAAGGSRHTKNKSMGSGNVATGVVLGHTVVIGENAEMAKWTARGGFNAPRSESQDSLKVPNGPILRGLSPAPRGKIVRPAMNKRPSTAEPSMGSIR